MNKLSIKDTKIIAENLNKGRLGVIPTDTIYGLSCSVRHQEAIDKLYKISNRDENKPCIILISNTEQTNELGINLVDFNVDTNKYWPGQNSLVFDCDSEKLKHLHRGKKSLAVRLPDFGDLRNIIELTGPIISTSANPQSLRPATNISEAYEYFGDMVDFYVEHGNLEGQASRVIKITNAGTEVLRN